MSAQIVPPSGGHAAPADAPPSLTLVELTWREKQIEFWIRFGRPCFQQIIDPHRRIVGFAPDTIFAFVRWTANDHGTIASRLDILRAVDAGEPHQTLPYVSPGGDILLKVEGWPRVARVLEAIDRIEASRIAPDDVPPDHWRHIHHRLAANEEPRNYTPLRHAAWLKRREVSS